MTVEPPVGASTPDSPDRHDLAVYEAAAAICPARDRRNQDPREGPCDACHALADSAIAAYLAAIQTAPEPDAP